MLAKDRRHTKLDCLIMMKDVAAETTKMVRSKLSKKDQRLIGDRMIDSAIDAVNSARFANGIKVDGNKNEAHLRMTKQNECVASLCDLETVNMLLPDIATNGAQIKASQQYENLSFHIANTIQKTEAWRHSDANKMAKMTKNYKDLKGSTAKQVPSDKAIPEEQKPAKIESPIKITNKYKFKQYQASKNVILNDIKNAKFEPDDKKETT